MREKCREGELAPVACQIEFASFTHPRPGGDLPSVRGIEKVRENKNKEKPRGR